MNHETTPDSGTLTCIAILSGVLASAAPAESLVLSPKLALGGNYGIAITEEGGVVSWGSDHLGDLSGITDAVEVAAFWGHALILKSDGTVIAVGSNGSGECEVPANLPPIVAIGAGYQKTWVVDNVGRVHAWGNDYWCGAGSSSLHVPAGLVATSVSAGNAHWLFRDIGGWVGGSGCNYNGQLNIPSSLQPAIDFEAAESWSSIIGADGRIHAYGFNGIGGQLNTPSGDGFVDIACGYYFGVAAREDGSVATWGSNQQGERNIPDGMPATIAVEASGYYAAAVHEDGTLTMWGQNDYGELDHPNDLRIRTHDRDCDGDGVADWREIIEGTTIDTDGDGIPDPCDEDTPGDCRGDITENGAVDAVDMGILLAVWGTSGKNNPRADIDGSGIVDAVDLGLLFIDWGTCP